MFNSLKFTMIKSNFIIILCISVIIIFLSGCSSIWLNEKKPKYNSYNECLVISVIGKGGSQDDDLKLSHVNCNNRYAFPVVSKNHQQKSDSVSFLQKNKSLLPLFENGCGKRNDLYFISYGDLTWNEALALNYDMSTSFGYISESDSKDFPSRSFLEKYNILKKCKNITDYGVYVGRKMIFTGYRRINEDEYYHPSQKKTKLNIVFNKYGENKIKTEIEQGNISFYDAVVMKNKGLKPDEIVYFAKTNYSVKEASYFINTLRFNVEDIDLLSKMKPNPLKDNKINSPGAPIQKIQTLKKGYTAEKIPVGLMYKWHKAGLPVEKFDLIVKYNEYNISPEWFGFSPKEANGWKVNGFSVQSAVHWKDSGVAPNQAKQWKQNGFTQKTLQPWVKKHFTPHDAKLWVDYGFDIGEAINWSETGISPQEANIYKKNEVSLNEAVSWRQFEFTVKQTLLFKKNNIGISEAKIWKKSGAGDSAGATPGSTTFNISGILKWKSEFTASQANDWISNGFSYSEAKIWKDSFKPLEAKSIMSLNIEYKTAVEYKNEGIDIQYYEWIYNNVPLEAVKKYHTKYTLKEYLLIRDKVETIDERSIRFALDNNLTKELSKPNSYNSINTIHNGIIKISSCRSFVRLLISSQYSSDCNENTGTVDLFNKIDPELIIERCPSYVVKENIQKDRFLVAGLIHKGMKESIGCTRHRKIINQKLFDGVKNRWKPVKYLVRFTCTFDRSSYPFGVCMKNGTLKINNRIVDLYSIRSNPYEVELNRNSTIYIQAGELDVFKIGIEILKNSTTVNRTEIANSYGIERINLSRISKSSASRSTNQKKYKLIFSCSLWKSPMQIIQCFQSHRGLEASLKITTQMGSKTYKTHDNEIINSPQNLEIDISGRFIVQFRANSEKNIITTLSVYDGKNNLIYEDQAANLGRIQYRSP